MKSGRLRDNIIIKRSKGEQGSKGQLLNTFNIICRAKADFKVLSGSEQIKAGISLNTEYASVLIRRNDKIKHKDIIEWNGDDYTVGAIRPMNKNSQMLITVSRDI